MHNAQLNGKEISDLIPIGLDGVPVYMNAESFRDAIERTPELGTHWARHLAKPRFNGDFSHVDWYVPFDPQNPDGEYRIISWQQATPEEKTAALKILKEFENRLHRVGQNLKRTSLSKDTISFAHMLTGTRESDNLPAIHFPGPEYVFIVDGLPVITFWGFLKPGQAVNVSPFASLESAAAKGGSAADAAPSAKEAPQKAAGGFPAWLKWLLLLLLLLLLLGAALFALRSCQSPEVTLPDGPNLNVPDAALPDADLPNVNLPDANLPDVNLPSVNLPDAEIPNVNLPDVNLPDVHLNGEIPAAELPAVNLPEAGISEGEVIAGSVLDGTAEISAKEAADPEAVTEEPAAEAADLNAAAEESANAAEENALTEPQTAAEEAAADPISGASGEEIPEPAQLNQTQIASEENPLQLSQTEISSGNLSSLEGAWQTRSGMMDSTTGRPLNLSYNYANGQGELVVQRQDGTRCVTKANPTVVNSTVEIVAQSTALCPDKSSYVLPKIKCETNAQGGTDCHAEYEGQAPFKIRMYKNQN